MVLTAKAFFVFTPIVLNLLLLLPSKTTLTTGMHELKPLFSTVDQLLIREGLQKIINECDEHVAVMEKGQQGLEDDATLQSIISIYTYRKEQCTGIINKLSLLRTLNTMPA